MLLRRYLSLPPIAIRSSAPPEATESEASTPAAEASRRVGAPDLAAMQTYDAKLLAVAPLLMSTDWERVRELLSHEPELPPQLALLYAMAQKECGTHDGSPEDTAIRAMSALLCVPPDHIVATLLAKRLLRKNPAAWRTRKAPPAHISLLLIAVVAAAGAAIGYLIGPGFVLFGG
jgi:hypothetical protein